MSYQAGMQYDNLGGDSTFGLVDANNNIYMLIGLLDVLPSKLL